MEHGISVKKPGKLIPPPKKKNKQKTPQNRNSLEIEF